MTNQHNVKKFLSVLLCIAVLFSCLSGVCFPASAETAESSFQIHFIDVGQADAALILCDGEAMLIDGGNVADSQIMYSYMQKLDIKRLDYVIGTHPHEDHIGGIAGALQYVESVGTAYCSATSYVGSAFPQFVTAVENHGISIQVPTVGTSFTLGSAACKIIAVNTPSEDVNDSSIVMRITYGDNSFLFTGDAEVPVENVLLNGTETLKSDVLKVGHHGSNSSTSYLWLRTVDPDYAVICVGANNEYGHPTEAVLSRLRDADVKTYRTDMQGDIICTSDGTNITFTVARNPNADTFGGIGDNSTAAPSDPTQIVDQAYALRAGQSLPYTATLTGTILQVDTPFDTAYNRITVTIAVEGRQAYPIQCYNLSGNGADQLQVGDTVTVNGTLKNYYGLIEFYFPSMVSYRDNTNISEPVSKIDATPAASVTADAPYKLVLDRKGTKYYFTGKTDNTSYYLASSTDPAAAVTVYLEGERDSYRIYFINNGVKTYIRLYERVSGSYNAGKPSLALTTTAPAERYRFDTTLKTLVYTPNAYNSYYMGTYSTYTNFSSSNLSYVTGSNAANVDVSQYPARLYAVQTNENSVSQWSVTLKENIGITFMMNFTEKILADNGAWVSLTFDGQETKIPVSEAVNGIHFDVAAAQMTEKIAICTVSGDGTRTQAKYYSVRDYADRILSGSYDETTKELVRAMLSFGGASQEYFTYRTDALADDGVSVTQQTVPTQTDLPVSATGRIENVQIYGATLILASTTYVRLYFNVHSDISGYSFTADGTTLTPVEKDGMYYVQLGDLLPQDIHKPVNLQVSDGQGNSIDVTYSPLNYIVRMYHGTASQALKEMLQTLYTYHIAAINYVS